MNYYVFKYYPYGSPIPDGSYIIKVNAKDFDDAVENAQSLIQNNQGSQENLQLLEIEKYCFNSSENEVHDYLYEFDVHYSQYTYTKTVKTSIWADSLSEARNKARNAFDEFDRDILYFTLKEIKETL